MSEEKITIEDKRDINTKANKTDIEKAPSNGSPNIFSNLKEKYLAFDDINKWKKAERNIKKIWVIHGITVTACFIALAIGNYFWWLDKYAKVAIPTMVALAILNFIYYVILVPIIGYEQFRYVIREDRVEIRKGIFVRNYYTIPIIRIQLLEVTTGPLYRYYGLCKVSIITTSGSETITGIKAEDGEALRLYLKDRVKNQIMSNKKILQQLAMEAEHEA